MEKVGIEREDFYEVQRRSLTENLRADGKDEHPEH